MRPTGIIFGIIGLLGLLPLLIVIAISVGIEPGTPCSEVPAIDPAHVWGHRGLVAACINAETGAYQGGWPVLVFITPLTLGSLITLDVSRRTAR